MPIPTDRLSALAVQQLFAESAARQQSMLSMGGLAAVLGQQVQQTYIADYKKEPEGIREELQAETDKWLKDIK